MLTPKTTAMNPANAPHCTRYRRTAKSRNHPRTTPMSRSPSWLMSVSFPPGRGTLSRPTQIKEPRRFSRDITRDRRDGRQKAQLPRPPMPAGEGSAVSAPTFCPTCGSSNAPSNNFCLNCGTRLISTGTAALPPTYPPSYPPAYPSGYPAPPAYPMPVPPAYPGGYPPYAWGPPMRGSRAGDILSGTFEVWSKDVASYFVVYLVLAAVTGVIGGALSLALIGTFGVGAIIPGTSSGTGIALICGLAGALVLGGILAIYVSVALSLYAPAIMIEGVGAVDGLKRSWALTKGHRLSLFGASFVVGLLSAVVTGAITFPAGLPGLWLVSLVARALASAIVVPWAVILAAVAYDLILRPFPSMGTAPPGMPVTPPAGPAPPTPPTQPPGA